MSALIFNVCMWSSTSVVKHPFQGILFGGRFSHFISNSCLAESSGSVGVVCAAPSEEVAEDKKPHKLSFFSRLFTAVKRRNSRINPE